MNKLIRSYYKVKPFIPRQSQIMLRRFVASVTRIHNNDVWPIDPIASSAPQEWRGWPDGKRFAVVLTHDVETGRGHNRCMQLMRIEQEAGFRSSFNFVGGEYEVSKKLRRDLVENGFEIGVHGWVHNSSLYDSREEFQRQSVYINNCLEEWGAVGFRAPCMYHNLQWFHDLRIKYDSSTFDVDPFEPQNDGVTTIFPFFVHGEQPGSGYVEIPYTLPQDFTLFILLREKNIEIWKDKLRWIAEHGGMALLNTHPDYMKFSGTPGFEEYPASLYLEFLQHVNDVYRGAFWQPLPFEIAEFISNMEKTAGLAGGRYHVS